MMNFNESILMNQWFFKVCLPIFVSLSSSSTSIRRYLAVVVPQMKIAIKEKTMITFILKIKNLLIVRVMVAMDARENAFTIIEFLARSTSLYTNTLLQNTQYSNFCCAKILL